MSIYSSKLTSGGRAALDSTIVDLCLTILGAKMRRRSVESQVDYVG